MVTALPFDHCPREFATKFYLMSSSEATLQHPVTLWRKSCIAACKLGGEVLKEYQGRVVAREKRPKDLVTEADLESQRVIEGYLKQRFPSHRILGEESNLADDDPARMSGDSVRWIIDPLDGTTNFVHGLPNYCVTVAVERAGVVWAGAVYDPVLDECFHAGRNEGVWLDDTPLVGSQCMELESALIAAGFSPNVAPGSLEVARFESVLFKSQALRRLGSAALNLCYVAAGRLDGYFAESVKTWDVAAGVLMIELAGGSISAIDGGPFDLAHPRLAVASTKRLHQELLDALRV